MTPDEIKPRRMGYGVGVSGWEVVQAIPASEVGRMLKAAMDAEGEYICAERLAPRSDEDLSLAASAELIRDSWLAKAEELEAMK